MTKTIERRHFNTAIELRDWLNSLEDIAGMMIVDYQTDGIDLRVTEELLSDGSTVRDIRVDQ